MTDKSLHIIVSSNQVILYKINLRLGEEKTVELPTFKNLRVIVKEVFCRVGQDWHHEQLFINMLRGLDSEIAYMAAEELKISPKDLHDLTCAIKEIDKTSMTGDSYIAKKVLKLKVRITIEECELIDDLPAEPKN